MRKYILPVHIAIGLNLLFKHYSSSVFKKFNRTRFYNMCLKWDTLWFFWTLPSLVLQVSKCCLPIFAMVTIMLTMAGVSSMFNKKTITSTLNQNKKNNKTVAKPYYNLLTSFVWICDLKSVIQCINHNTITSTSELVAEITCGSIFVLITFTCLRSFFTNYRKYFTSTCRPYFFQKKHTFFILVSPTL